MPASVWITNPGPITGGDNLLVSWSGVDNPSPTDWIGVWPAGVPDVVNGISTRLVWKQTGGLAAGSMALPLWVLLPTGRYDVRLNAQDQLILLAQITFSVVDKPLSTLPPPSGGGGGGGGGGSTPAPAPAPAPGLKLPDLSGLLRNPVVLSLGGLALAWQFGLFGRRR